MPLTDDANDPRIMRGSVEVKPVPQAEVYLILSKAEREKGFVRPVRRSYIHVGLYPKYLLRDLTDDERIRFSDYQYVKFEQYPESESPKVGRYWTQAQLDTIGCGTKTSMADALAETYARDPDFYGATYCCGCEMHRPVSEFVWDPDGTVVGS